MMKNRAREEDEAEEDEKLSEEEKKMIEDVEKRLPWLKKKLEGADASKNKELYLTVYG